jgi:hypothetical protein
VVRVDIAQPVQLPCVRMERLRLRLRGAPVIRGLLIALAVFALLEVALGAAIIIGAIFL